MLKALLWLLYQILKIVISRIEQQDSKVYHNYLIFDIKKMHWRFAKKCNLTSLVFIRWVK